MALAMAETEAVVDTDIIVKTAFFDAPRDVVWSFLTDRERLATWFHPAKEDLRAGKDYALCRAGNDGAMVPLIWGRVIRADEPDELAYTFEIEEFSGNATTVTWTLEEVAGGTKLTLRHEGVAEAAGAAAMGLLCALDDGWDEHIGKLREAVKG